MQDRPTVDQLLEAVAGFLTDDVMPNTSGRINFHARVSANVLQMLRRELQLREEHFDREWQGLDSLLGPSPKPGSISATESGLETRNRELSERIRTGDGDGGQWRKTLLGHLRQTVHDKLVVSNPALAAEAPNVP